MKIQLLITEEQMLELCGEHSFSAVQRALEDAFDKIVVNGDTIYLNCDVEIVTV